MFRSGALPDWSGEGFFIIRENREPFLLIPQKHPLLRLPLIPGYNDTPDNLADLADFIQRVGLHELNLLPFHRLGESKWSQLGWEYPYRQQPSPAPEALERIQDFFLGKRIACYKGSHTPF